MLVGAAVMLVGVVGIRRSRGNYPGGSTLGMTGRAADAAALAGLAVAVAGLLAVILTSILIVGPCGRSPATGSCFLAHPEFYQHDASGFFYSTAAERISLPLALVPGLLSGLALTVGTGRRGAALSGLIIGSLPLVAFAALTGLDELRFLGGGFD